MNKIDTNLREALAGLREALEQVSKIHANVLDHYSWKAQAEAYKIAFSEVQGIACNALAAQVRRK